MGSGLRRGSGPGSGSGLPQPRRAKREEARHEAAELGRAVERRDEDAHAHRAQGGQAEHAEQRLER